MFRIAMAARPTTRQYGIVAVGGLTLLAVAGICCAGLKHRDAALSLFSVADAVAMLALPRL